MTPKETKTFSTTTKVLTEKIKVIFPRKSRLLQPDVMRRFSNLSLEEKDFIRHVSVREGLLANYIQLVKDGDVEKWISALEYRMKDSEKRRNEHIGEINKPNNKKP